MEGKLVSIIIPTYNDAHYIDRLFEDIVAQTYKNVEYIIVNDCSTDNTKEKVLAFVEKCKNEPFKVVYAETPQNSRTGGAINWGLKQAHGELLSWWSSDDAKYPNFIEEMIKPFMADEEVDYVIGGFVDKGMHHRPYHVCDGEFYLNSRWVTTEPETDDIYITDKKMQFMTAHHQQCLNGISYMWSRYVLGLFGDFLTKPEEDYHMSVRMIRLARKIGFLNKSVAEYFLRPDSLTVVGFKEGCRNETMEEFRKFFYPQEGDK